MIVDFWQLARLGVVKALEGLAAGLLLVAFVGLLVLLAVASYGHSAGCSP